MAKGAKEGLVRTVAEFADLVLQKEFRLGLEVTPVTPWYLGHPDDGTAILPQLYRGAFDVTLERELLRDFRMSVAEFTSTKGMLDEDLMLLAHGSTLPSRIIEWTGNPLVALFLAVESMNEAKPGRVWVFNPWAFNEAVASLAYVPMTDTDFFRRYVVALNPPDGALLPLAELPLAFRPFRTARPNNTQSIYYTVHGYAKEAIDAMKLFGRKREAYLVPITVAAERKKAIMRELYVLGVTRANLTPGPPALARTLTYRYSNDYLNAVP